MSFDANLSDLVESYIQKGEPPLSQLLQDERFSENNVAVDLLQPFDELRVKREDNTANSSDKDGEKTFVSQRSLRRLSLQASLRVLLLQRDVDASQQYLQQSTTSTVTSNKKKKAKVSKRKRTQVSLSPLHDIHRVLALAAFCLPPETLFVSYLQDLCRDAMISESIRRRIYQSFELSAEAEKEEEAPRAPTVRGGKKRSRAVIALPPAPREPVLPPSKPSTTSFLPPSVSLVAPRQAQKKNSLLTNSTARRFVGSHFNTNLHNTSHLFRSVAAVPLEVRKKTAAAPPTQKTSVAQISRICETPLNPRAHASRNGLLRQKNSKKTEVRVSSKDIVDQALQALRNRR